MQQGSADLRTKVILFGIKLAPDYARMAILTRMSQILCISILSFYISLKQQDNETNHSMAKSWSFPISPRNPAKYLYKSTIRSTFIDLGCNPFYVVTLF